MLGTVKMLIEVVLLMQTLQFALVWQYSYYRSYTIRAKTGASHVLSLYLTLSQVKYCSV